MNEHYLIKKAVDIPKKAQILADQEFSSSKLLYVTKTYAAPGDDDDIDGVKIVWSPWESLFY